MVITWQARIRAHRRLVVAWMAFRGSWTVMDPGLYVLQDCRKGRKIINSKREDDNFVFVQCSNLPRGGVHTQLVRVLACRTPSIHPPRPTARPPSRLLLRSMKRISTGDRRARTKPRLVIF